MITTNGFFYYSYIKFLNFDSINIDLFSNNLIEGYQTLHKVIDFFIVKAHSFLLNLFNAAVPKDLPSMGRLTFSITPLSLQKHF